MYISQLLIVKSFYFNVIERLIQHNFAIIQPYDKQLINVYYHPIIWHMQFADSKTRIAVFQTCRLPSNIQLCLICENDFDISILHDLRIGNDAYIEYMDNDWKRVTFDIGRDNIGFIFDENQFCIPSYITRPFLKKKKTQILKLLKKKLFLPAWDLILELMYESKLHFMKKNTKPFSLDDIVELYTEEQKKNNDIK